MKILNKSYNENRKLIKKIAKNRVNKPWMSLQRKLIYIGVSQKCKESKLKTDKRNIKKNIDTNQETLKNYFSEQLYGCKDNTKETLGIINCGIKSSVIKSTFPNYFVKGNKDI